MSERSEPVDRSEPVEPVERREPPAHRSPGAVWQESMVTREQRWGGNGLTGATVWLTGFSGAGKSTVADQALAKLVAAGRLAYVLDADNLRHGLNSDLGYSPQDRSENARRVGEVARLLADAGVICLVPIISPYRADRRRVRHAHDDAGLRFVEVFVDTALDVCIDRDPKGLYRRARIGDLQQLTGVSAPYEVPERPELHLRTAGLGPEPLAEAVVELILHG